MALALAMAWLTGCDAEPEMSQEAAAKEVTSQVLSQELGRVAEEVVANPVVKPPARTAQPDRESVLKEVHAALPGALVVTAGQEAKFERGGFDDAANRATVQKSTEVINDLKAEVPLLMQHLFVSHGKQPLTAARLELLARLSDRLVEQIAERVRRSKK